jgi:WD40 repeat protein
VIARLLAQIVAVAAHGDAVVVVTQQGVRLNEAPIETRLLQPVGAAFSRDGRPAVFGGTPGERGGVEFGGWSETGHADLVTAVAFGPDWIAGASADRTIGILTLDGRRRHTLKGHPSALLALAASPDGKRLVSGGADATLRVWDPQDGRLLRVLAGHGDRVNALAWSPDGRHLASGSRDRSVRIWQPEIGRMLRIVPHEAEVLALAWPDELVTAAADGQIRRLAELGLKELARHDAGARAGSIAVVPGGILVAAGSLLRLPR